MKLSILMLSWNRPENINEILTAYNDYNIIDDIIVWNNKRTQELNYLPEWEGKIKFINSHDFGLNTRFIGALLCKNEWVLTNDDDILLSEGTINHFSEWAKNHPDRTYTLHGRNPTAQNTYADGVENVVVPKETDMHLTRATCYKKKYVIDYIRFIMDNDINYFTDETLSNAQLKARATSIDFDGKALSENYVSITPVHYRLTNESYLEELKQQFLDE